MKKEEAISITASFLTVILLLVASVGAWVQHFVTSITEELWVVLVIGAIIPPVGVLHGWLVWLGVL